ncbi:MAG: TetR/AcrR family transcriptional regulator [Mycobacteriaceae bacterium]
MSDTTRTRIRNVFAQHLATTGYQGLSLDAVAREAGIKKPTLYHHFPGGKETIYAEVAHDFIDTQHTALAAAIATEGDLSARLVAIVDAFADPAAAQVSFGQRLFDALPFVGADIRDEVSSSYVSKLLAPVEELFRVAIADHHVREDEPSFLANAFLHLARATDLDPDNPQMAHRLVALFLDGAHGNVPTTS